jgi:hypothetical protein
METAKVNVREFRNNFGNYSEADKAVTVTKHGRTIGFYIPVRRKPTSEDVVAFREAREAVQAWMVSQGVTEDELLEEFKRLRKEKRRGG